MTDMPPDRSRVRVYRATRRSRRYPRRRLWALGAALLVIIALGVGVWVGAAGGGQSGAGGETRAPNPAGTAVAAGSQSPPPPTPSPSPPAVIEVGWVGDTTPGSKYGLPPNGGRALFSSVRDVLLGPDLMITNLEGTYSTGGPSKCDGRDSANCFAFQAPPEYAKALAWAGVDLVSLANNHTYDYFERGLQQTTSALRSAGILYTGLPGQVAVVRVAGVRVGAVGFSPYPWNADINDIPGARRLVRRAAARADVVVVLMHAGAEGADKTHTPRGTEMAYGEVRGNARTFAHAVIDAGADLVLGSGPHVIRGIEKYKDRLIAYSLGNFAGWDNFGLGGNLSVSGLLTVRIDERGEIHGGRWLSVRLAEPGVPRIDAGHTAAGLVRQLSAEDFARTYKLDAQGSFKAR